MNRSTMCLVVVALVASSACIDNPPECYQRPIDEEGPWVLTDHYHSTKQNPVDYKMTKTNFNYQGVFGFHRVFQHLELNGYNWSEIRNMPLSKERLEGYDVLFINLVSSDRPDFEDDEVDAIIEFVENGGGLFVIADHTNVYRHAERVNRFLVPMGIEVMYHIATDQPSSGHAIGGTGWILVDDFTEHPVAKNLDIVSLQTGGPVRTEDAEGAVALTSEDSFADFWDPNDKGGFYGNWSWDGDEEVEPLGPLEVVSAVEFGEGRVVVVGDQNIFGDSWAHYVDNFELAMNSFEWTAKHENDPTPLRAFRPVGTMIGVDQTHNEYRGGKSGRESQFVFYVNTNRDPEITGHGSIRFDNVDDALILFDPTVAFSEIELQQLREYFKDGKKVVLTFEGDEISGAAQQFLAEFAPEFQLTSQDGTYSVEDGTLVEALATTISGKHLPLESDKLEVEGLSVGSYEEDPTKTEDVVEPYMLDITSDWGSPFIQAKNGSDTIDIARSKTVEEGELIIFMQDGLFRNRTMGDYLRAPGDYNKDVHELQYRLMDYLKIDVPEDRLPIEENTRCN